MDQTAANVETNESNQRWAQLAQACDEAQYLLNMYEHSEEYQTLQTDGALAFVIPGRPVETRAVAEQLLGAANELFGQCARLESLMALTQEDVQAANQVNDEMIAIILYQFINTQAYLEETAAFFMRGTRVAFSNQEQMTFNTWAHRDSCNLGLVLRAMMADLQTHRQQLAACEPYVPLSPQTAHLGPEFHRLIHRVEGQLESFRILVRLMDKLNAIRFFRRFEFHINTMFQEEPTSAQWGIHAAYNVTQSPGRIVQGYDQDKFELFAQVLTMLREIGREMLDELEEFEELESALTSDVDGGQRLAEAYDQFKVEFCQVYNLPADLPTFEVDYGNLAYVFDQCRLQCENWAIELENKYMRLGREWDEVPQLPEQPEQAEEEMEQPQQEEEGQEKEEEEEG